MDQILSIIQIVICVAIVSLILLQQRGTAIGSAFGGGSEVYSTRRGFQKHLLWMTVVLVVLFVIISILLNHDILSILKSLNLAK
ncbi:preprotein translocase subunit SecG [bacterium]|nr:preprotein translocase subunit SecG [bacterium]